MTSSSSLGPLLRGAFVLYGMQSIWARGVSNPVPSVQASSSPSSLPFVYSMHSSTGAAGLDGQEPVPRPTGAVSHICCARCSRFLCHSPSTTFNQPINKSTTQPTKTGGGQPAPRPRPVPAPPPLAPPPPLDQGARCLPTPRPRSRRPRTRWGQSPFKVTGFSGRTWLAIII
jgi:hypothetical protein